MIIEIIIQMTSMNKKFLFLNLFKILLASNCDLYPSSKVNKISLFLTTSSNFFNEIEPIILENLCHHVNDVPLMFP